MLRIVIVAVEAISELVRRPNVEIVLGRLVRPPVPKLATVEASAAFNNDVETKLRRFGTETKFNKFGVDTKFSKFADEMKPDRPTPVSVDCRVVSRNVVETKFSKF